MELIYAGIALSTGFIITIIFAYFYEFTVPFIKNVKYYLRKVEPAYGMDLKLLAASIGVNIDPCKKCSRSTKGIKYFLFWRHLHRSIVKRTKWIESFVILLLN